MVQLINLDMLIQDIFLNLGSICDNLHTRNGEREAGKEEEEMQSIQSLRHRRHQLNEDKWYKVMPTS